jgi:hypothetical protein
MVEKIRKSQEEKVIEMLKREGFRELSEKEIQKEPHKSIYRMPECFKKESEGVSHNS